MRYREITEAGRPRQSFEAPARLFHGTTVIALASILHGDTLSAAQRDDYGPEGVSFSTDDNVAWAFAEMREDQEQDMTYPDEFETIKRTRGAVIEVDGAAMQAAGLKMKRVRVSRGSHGMSFRGEAEVRLLSDLHPLSRFCTSIRCRHADIDTTITMLRSVKSGAYWQGVAPAWIIALERLKGDPRLRG